MLPSRDQLNDICFRKFPELPRTCDIQPVQYADDFPRGLGPMGLGALIVACDLTPQIEKSAVLENSDQLHEPCSSNGHYPVPVVAEVSAIGGVDKARIRAAVREILFAVGENPDRDGLLETPDRVARMYAEIFAGLHSNPRVHLQKTFEVDHEEMVLQRDIEFSSFCEHHLLPFTGRAHIAYIPTGRVVGLSKLARVVEGIAKKPQVQERMTQEIADLLQEELIPRGVLVVVEATHSCMTIRGVRKPGTVCVTSAARGLYQTNSSSRAEVMNLITHARPLG